MYLIKKNNNNNLTRINRSNCFKIAIYNFNNNNKSTKHFFLNKINILNM